MKLSKPLLKKYFQGLIEPTIIIKISFVVILILFSPLIIDLYCDIVVDPLLSQFKANPYFDVIIILSTLITGAIVVYKSIKLYKGLVNAQSVFFLSIIVITYWITRFNQQFTYKYFNLFPTIFITDYIVVILSIILFILFYLSVYRYIKKETEKVTDVEDQLSREPYAISIANQILKNKRMVNSYAIGITGCWGDGKTVFMELIKKELSKSNECIVIDFNPWYSTNPKTLIHDFFSTLENELSKYNPNIKNSFWTYARLLTKFQDSNSSLENIIDVFWKSSQTIRDKFEEIKKEIKIIDKQIIICIDDLDRLDKEEVVETIRLIRNTANFDNTMFLVTYDKNYVVSALKSMNDYATETYLEKIFQQELVLPAYNNEFLKLQLEELLIEKVNGDTQTLFSSILREFSYRFRFRVFFKNLRSVNQFINSFYQPFNQIKSDVHETDFFFIHLLSFRFPEVYRAIKNDIFQLDFGSSLYFELAQLHEQYNIISLKTINKEKDKDITNEYYIESYLEKNYSKEESNNITALLKMLFPFSKNYSIIPKRDIDNYKRIYYKFNFQKYFAFKLSYNDIPYKELNKAFELNEYELKNQIEYWCRNMKSDSLFIYFEQRIETITQKDEYEKFIRSIVIFGNQPNLEEPHKELSFNFYIFRDNIISNKIRGYYRDEEEYKIFIISLMRMSFYPALFTTHYLSDEIKNLKSNNNQNSFPLSEEEIIEINIFHLKSYLEHSSELKVQAFWLYHCCDNKNKEKNKDAGNLILDFAKNRDLKNFLRFMLDQPPVRTNRFYLSDLVFQLFGKENFEGFKSFLEEANNDTPYYYEFMEFYKQYCANDFTTTTFEFEHLNIQNRWLSD